VLPEHHVRVRYGVPVTSAARTVVDLGGELSFKAGALIADSALRLGLASQGQLREVVCDCYCSPGIRAAQRVVAFADRKAGSVLESVSRVAFHEEGLPPPETQVLIADEWGPFAEVDFRWPEFNVIGEADGIGKYDADEWRSPRDKIRAEKRREERLFDAGYEVVRWGWEDATNPPRRAKRLWAAFERGAERKRGRRHSVAAPRSDSRRP
jgi:hypothetical protein